jgi:hypothetical protein
MRFGDALLAPAKWRLNSKRWADKEWCEEEVAGSPGEQERQRRLERADAQPGIRDMTKIGPVFPNFIPHQQRHH